MTQLLSLVLAVEAMANVGDTDYDVLDAAVNSLAIAIMGWLSILRALRVADGLLFDIPPDEEAAPLTFTKKKHLRIYDLSDMAALKMTRFKWCNLRRLYAAFDLDGQLEPMSIKLAIPTGHFTLPAATESTQKRFFCSLSASWRRV